MKDTERKVQLTRFLREENAQNRMKLKNRESILYGSGKPAYGNDGLPLVYDGYLNGEESDFSRRPQQGSGSAFGLRVLAAVFLFGAMVYLDKNGILFRGELAAQVIARQVSVSAEGKLIDFVSNFPYTLSDKDE